MLGGLSNLLDTGRAGKSQFFYGGRRINRVDPCVLEPGPEQSLALIHARQRSAAVVIMPD